MVIFDLDGCVSDDRWRLDLLPSAEDVEHKGCQAWDVYHLQAERDEPRNVGLVEWFDGHLVFITARPDRFRAETVRWIGAHFKLNEAYTLLMRPDGNSDSSPVLKPKLFEDRFGDAWSEVAFAYDDRPDVIAAYKDRGVEDAIVLTVEGPDDGLVSESPADVLKAAAATYEERNAVYGSNWRRVPEVMRAMFPDGVPGDLVTEPEWHLFELIVVKLTRFANGRLRHEDSIHDVAVYAAMIQSIIKEKG